MESSYINILGWGKPHAVFNNVMMKTNYHMRVYANMQKLV